MMKQKILKKVIAFTLVATMLCGNGVYAMAQTKSEVSETIQKDSVSVEPSDDVTVLEEYQQYVADGTYEARVEAMEKLAEVNSTHLLNANIVSTAENATAKQSQIMPYDGLMPSTGEVKALVFLVSFPDLSKSDEVTAELRKAELFNLEDVSSFSGFYYASSYEQLALDGEVYGYYEAQNDSTYYEEAGWYTGNQLLINEIMEYYDEQIDYSDYDADGDGLIDALYIEYAREDDGWGGFWWSYKTNWVSGIGAEQVSYDGVKTQQYVWLNGFMDEIVNVYKHETGHLLGLADYYDNISGTVDGGLGAFDMMVDNNSDHNVFSKMLLGWLEPVEVSDATKLELRSSQLYPDAAIIYPNNDATGDEYFMVEYITSDAANVNQEMQIGEGGIRVWRVNAKLNEAGTDYAYINCREGKKLIEAVGITNWSTHDSSGGLRYTTNDLATTNIYYEGDVLTPTSNPSSYIYGDCEAFYGPFTTSGIVMDGITIDEDSASVNISYDYQQKTDFAYEMEYVFGTMLMIELTFDYETTLLDASKISVSNGERDIDIVAELSYTPDYGFKKMYIVSPKTEDIVADGEFALTIEAGALTNVFGTENSEITERLTARNYTGTLVKEFSAVDKDCSEDYYTQLIELNNEAYMFYRFDSKLWLVRFYENENGAIETEETYLMDCDMYHKILPYVLEDKILLEIYDNAGSLYMYLIETNGEHELIYEAEGLRYYPYIHTLGNNFLVSEFDTNIVTLVKTDSGETELFYANQFSCPVTEAWDMGDNINIVVYDSRLLFVDDTFNVISEIDTDAMGLGSGEKYKDFFAVDGGVGVLTTCADGTDEDTYVIYLDEELNFIKRKQILSNSVYGASSSGTDKGTVIPFEEGYLVQLESDANYMLRYYNAFPCDEEWGKVTVFSQTMVYDKEFNYVGSIAQWSVTNDYASVGKSLMWAPSYGTYYYCLDTIDMTPVEQEITEVSLETTELSLAEGSIYRLNEKYAPCDAATEIAWTSSNDKVVTVDGNGILTAVGEGTADVIVTLGGEGGVSAKCTVVVRDKYTQLTTDSEVTVSVDVSGENAWYIFVPEEDGAYNFYSTGEFDTYAGLYDKYKRPLSGNDDGGEGMNFSVETQLVAGTIYYLAVRNESNVVGTFNICVQKLVPATGMEITYDELLEGYVGEYLSLYVTFSPENGFNEKVTWTSSNEEVATVNAYGLVTRKSEGTAVITATSESGFTDSVTVSAIKQKELSEGTNETIEIIQEGQDVWCQFTPTEDGVYWFYSTGEFNTYINLYNEDMEFLSYDNDGGEESNFKLETSLVAGETYYLEVRCLDETGIFDVCIQRIVPATSIEISNGDFLKYHIGDTVQLETIFGPENALQEEVTWTSSNGDVVVVDSAGWATFTKEGMATVTVTSESGLKDSVTVVVTGDTEDVLTSDGDENVYLEFEKNVLEQDVTLLVEKYEKEDDICQEIKPEDEVEFIVFEINLVNEEGDKVQPDGKVKVTIALPEGYDEATSYVYYVSDESEYTNMHATCEGGYISFETDHFSLYMLTSEKLESVVDVMRGDANGDGKVNARDVLLFRQYLAGGYDITIDTDACDVNNDGKVNARDMLLLRQYLAGGYDVELK